MFPQIVQMCADSERLSVLAETYLGIYPTENKMAKFAMEFSNRKNGVAELATEFHLGGKQIDKIGN